MIDECIAPVILALWAEEKQTRGCCCGHGLKNPSIVITKAYHYSDMELIQNIIKSMDDRDWDICQWQLVDVTPEPQQIAGSPGERVG